ncbi:MAG: TonB family protein [Beijerinckiaceae bacterium]
MTHEPDTTDAAFKADPSQRLIAPREGHAHPQFALILAVCLAAHALLLAILLFEDFSVASEPPLAEEFPVEIVAELPPELQAEPFAKPLPPPPDLVTPPVVKAKPPPEKTQLDDVEVAHDAPVSGNADDTHKGDPDKETKAPRAAPPPKLAAKQPAQEKPEQEKAATASNEKAANPPAPSEPQKLADDTPGAEALDKAQPEPPAKPQKKPTPRRDSKRPAAQGQKATVAQQLAALSQAPNYSLGAAAKSAPIGGGTEKASYEALLFGLITRQFHFPRDARARHLISVGQIGLFVDELGNLTHQAVYRASGDPALDTAWLAAVRRAAPFPAPPRGLPHGFILQYSNQN